MNINRDNYEEYFLLYTDNELSVMERAAVDEFVLQNSDLKEELVMLQETTLIPEAILLENKGSLLQAENINSSLQEKLLLLLDNELDDESIAAIKSAAAADTEIEKEWQLLKQTKLIANEKIIFTDKAVLYKKEKGKLIPMGWRIAAAAVLIGFGLWSTVSYFNRTSIAPGNAGLATKPMADPAPKESIKNLQEQQERNGSTAANTVAANVNKMSNTADAVPAGKAKITKSVNAAGDQKLQHGNDVVVKDPKSKKSSNNLPVPALEKIIKDDGNNIAVANVPSAKNNQIKALDNPNVTEAAQPYAINTAFADNKDEKITYSFEEEDQPKKTKIGGFFKKLNRVLQRKANIKTGSGDSFKVANLSFAVQ